MQVTLTCAAANLWFSREENYAYLLVNIPVSQTQQREHILEQLPLAVNYFSPRLYCESAIV